MAQKRNNQGSSWVTLLESFQGLLDIALESCVFFFISLGPHSLSFGKFFRKPGTTKN